MTESHIVLVVVFTILVAIAIFYIATAKGRKRRKYARQLAYTALSDFNDLCNPGRNFTNQELTDYKNKYSILEKEVRSNGKKFNRFYINKIDKSNPNFSEEFLSIYDNGDARLIENNRHHTMVQLINEQASELFSELTSKLPSDPNVWQYFSFSECEALTRKFTDLISAIKSVYPRFKKYIHEPCIESLSKLLNNLEEKRLSYNHNIYVPKISDCYSVYFDNLLSYPLDIQQRRAIVADEDNTLVISSAGSGKTSTIIGKAKYLLDIHKIDPQKILILTYTRKAAAELVKRLGNEEVDCSTFHSLAVRILGKLENRKPSICDASLLLNVFHSLLRTDHKFLSSILNYILHLQSLMKLEHEYKNAPDYFSDRKKYGIQAPYPDMRGKIIFTRSEEEKRICTYLTELGVDFLYEEPYPFATYTNDYRQYKPDFTIVVKEQVVDPNTGAKSVKERRVYLEHFAVDANGNVPKWFGDKDPIGGWVAQNKKYNDGIVWKRATHSQRGTLLLETRSADFHSGNIREVLKQQLIKANVPINPPTPEDLYARLVKRSQKIESSTFKLLEQFIALLKSNCGSIQPFIDKAKESNDTRTLAILSNVIKPLLEAYTKELKRRGEIDFTDAIIKATNYCAAGAWITYDYILVDEFQDISVDRYNFLQFLRSKEPHTKLFCVGDDWQSIYRFAGSNMKLFYKFEEFFGFTEHCKIEKTYRFFNPLLDLSSSFIQRNPEQMRKDVKCNEEPLPPQALESSLFPTDLIEIDGKELRFRRSDMPYVRKWLRKHHTTDFDFYDCGNSQQKDSMLNEVKAIVSTIPSRESILLLGRYNYDVRTLGFYTDKKDFEQGHESLYVSINGRKIRFMSVHAAKGLEADHVILINCNEGIYGFPSLVEDDPILGYVLSEEDQYEYAEERRLFYVALTRARYHLYVLYNGDKPSPFVRELTDVLKADEQLCPVCQQGHVVVIKHGMALNGNPYTNYGCSNANAGCEYFERVFGNNTPSFLIFNEKLKRGKTPMSTR